MTATAPPVLPAPQLQSQTQPTKWQREYEAFERLLPELRKSHQDQYVLIHNGAVFDHGPDDVALALRFFEKLGNVPVHIRFVTDKPTAAIRIPHYRELRNVETSE
jgi:hypothetical protein